MAAKLPPNVVKAPPSFDSPFRATERQPLQVVEERAVPAALPPAQAASPVVMVPHSVSAPMPLAPVAAAPVAAAQPSAELERKFTVRFTEEQWRVMHEACHTFRMQRGQSISAGELIRVVFDDWRARGAVLP